MTNTFSRPRRLSDAYTVGITLVEDLHHESLCTALEAIDGPFETLSDGYPAWHPAPHPFDAILKLFLYREITGCSYRELARYRNWLTPSVWTAFPTGQSSRGPGGRDSIRVSGNSSRPLHTTPSSARI